jgi:glucosamine 6-phosphate synthetase-like amidotransferase/phosphosugar isomerase protein
LLRESDAALLTQAAGIGVASTKAFTAQLMAFALLGCGSAACAARFPRTASGN